MHYFHPSRVPLGAWGFSMKIGTNIELRILNDEVVFRRGGDPAAQTGAELDHCRLSLALDVE